MKTRIISIITSHDTLVRNKVNDLQRQGFEVTDIKRISKMYLLFFGEDVTDITYQKQGGQNGKI